jgi:hypothetical protein
MPYLRPLWIAVYLRKCRLRREFNVVVVLRLPGSEIDWWGCNVVGEAEIFRIEEVTRLMWWGGNQHE